MYKDRTELTQKITAILVKTQFTAWIEANDTTLTAEEVKVRNDRAIDYVLGCSKEGKLTAEQMLERNRFNAVVDTQRAMIMELLDV